VRTVSVFRRLVGVEQATVTAVEVEEDESGPLLVVWLRPWKRQRSRCGRCQRRCPGYDQGTPGRRWRSVDLGLVRTLVQADLPRVRCPEHGVVAAHVPWAEHGAGHTRVFDQQVAWLAVKTSKSAVTELMRVAWRTVGAIVTRVWTRAEATAPTDRFDGLRRIAIDEVSYRKQRKYLLVVSDHDSGTLVWAGDRLSRATLRGFFDQLGPDRCARISHVSADGSDVIEDVVRERCPQAVLTADPFHVVAWANEALTQVRLEAWRHAKAAARLEPKQKAGWEWRWRPVATPAHDRVKALKGSRFALWKNPENLTLTQADKLAWIQATEPVLYRAYQLKETLRLIFKLPIEQAGPALQAWISRARRSRIGPFVELQRKIVRHQARILAAIAHGLNNGLAEAINTKIRLHTRIGFGYHSAEPLIALAMLSLGPHRPTLPGRR
jgi:transposase